jgi:flagellum-specific peptidoglycan hydrolase FlgJ
VDYGFYSAQYLSNIKSEGEYFQYLGQNYAEDPNYVSKIKQIISKTK